MTLVPNHLLQLSGNNLKTETQNPKLIARIKFDIFALDKINNHE